MKRVHWYGTFTGLVAILPEGRNNGLWFVTALNGQPVQRQCLEGAVAGTATG
ncbi:hypothetical protein [Prolixibacter bellariivorans]|uniref:hypothetical protein n=1 Tax=Prolixibacter bellariivorans TaxID=314319 RepID=UPI001298FE70|nr:hypothetical protein [Prolixibacter bellariivorans]